MTPSPEARYQRCGMPEKWHEGLPSQIHHPDFGDGLYFHAFVPPTEEARK